MMKAENISLYKDILGNIVSLIANIKIDGKTASGRVINDSELNSIIKNLNKIWKYVFKESAIPVLERKIQEIRNKTSGTDNSNPKTPVKPIVVRNYDPNKLTHFCKTFTKWDFKTYREILAEYMLDEFKMDLSLFDNEIEELKNDIDSVKAKREKIKDSLEKIKGKKGKDSKAGRDFTEERKELQDNDKILMEEQREIQGNINRAKQRLYEAKQNNKFNLDNTFSPAVRKFNKIASEQYEKLNGVLPEDIAKKFIADSKKRSLKDAWEYYPTPNKLIDRMIDLVGLKEGMKVLEPSAGTGNIVDRLCEKFDKIQVDVFEYNALNKLILKAKGYNIIGTDFLEDSENIGTKYDRIIMNPPFEGRIDIKHVETAFDMLADDGKLVAIVSGASLSREKQLIFRNKVDKYGQIEAIDKDFWQTDEDVERSANVTTAIIVLDKAKAIAYEKARKDREIDHTKFSVGDFVKHIQTDEVYKVTLVEDDFISFVSTKTFNKKKGWKTLEFDMSDEFAKYPSELVPISDEEADKLMKKLKEKADPNAYNCILSKNEYNNLCPQGSFKEIMEFVIARPHLTQTAKKNYVANMELGVPTTWFKPTAISGANLAIQSLEEFGAFILADGTGAGKTIQQLLTAYYFVKKLNKPFLIVTQSDKIIDQAFFGDAKKLGIDRMLIHDNEIITEADKVSKLENKIYLAKYPDFSLWKGKELPEFAEMVIAKEELADFENKYVRKIAYEIESQDLKVTKASEYRKKRKKDMYNDPIFVETLEKIDAYTFKQKKVFNELGEKFGGVAFDESHKLKNWVLHTEVDNKGSETSIAPKRAMWLAEATNHRMFVSATPTDTGEGLLYLMLAGVFRDKQEFESTMKRIGFTWIEPVYNDKKQLIFHGKWKAKDTESPSAFYGVDNLFEDQTEYGKMIKREIPLSNYEIVPYNVELPQEAIETYDAIEEYYMSKAEKEDSGNPTFQIIQDGLASAETYKFRTAIELAERELEDCRSVVIFCARKAESLPKAFGGLAIGSANEIIDYFQRKIGSDKVAIITGDNTKNMELHVNEFQANKRIVAVATFQAGSTGISLDDQTGDRARTIICLTAPYSGEQNVQMLGRIYRANTKTCSRAYYIFSQLAIDERIKGIVKRKMLMLGAVVQGETGALDPTAGAGEDLIFDPVDKSKKKEKTHTLFSKWKAGEKIDGSDFKPPVPLISWIILEKNWKGKTVRNTYIYIKAKTKNELVAFYEENKDYLDDKEFTMQSSRYEGSYLVKKTNLAPNSKFFTDFKEIGNWILNKISAETMDSIQSEIQLFEIGDVITFKNPVTFEKIKAGEKGKIVNVKKRNIAENDGVIYGYVYDVEANGKLVKNLSDYYLAKPIKTTDFALLSLHKEEILEAVNKHLDSSFEAIVVPKRSNFIKVYVPNRYNQYRIIEDVFNDEEEFILSDSNEVNKVIINTFEKIKTDYYSGTGLDGLGSNIKDSFIATTSEEYHNLKGIKTKNKGIYSLGQLKNIEVAGGLDLSNTKSLFKTLRPNHSVTIWGKQGSGKSSLALLLAEDYAKNGNVYFQSSEMPIHNGRMTKMVERLNINAENIYFNYSRDFATFEEASASGKFNFLILDSINKMRDWKKGSVLALQEKYPDLSFAYVLHADSSGKRPKGDPEAVYDCITEVKVEDKVATLNKHRDDDTDGRLNILNPEQKGSIFDAVPFGKLNIDYNNNF